jgi:hypothetical protein
MGIDTTIHRVPRYVVGVFFGLLLLLGWFVFADYGVSWDEVADRTNGQVSLRYAAELLTPGWAARHPVLQQAALIQNSYDNDHGVLFEFPLAWLDVVRPGTDLRTSFLLRHAAVFLVSLGGIWALFRLATLRFRDERLGLLAAALLVLSPRFFAESFYNGKDLPFVMTFTLSIYTLARLLERPSWRRAVVHGLVTAAAVDIRVLGLLLVPFTFTLLGLQFWSAPTLPGRHRLLRAGLAYGLTAVVAVVACWPFLWANPVRHLAIAYYSISHYAWGGSLLYLGHVIPAKIIPWHYALVWMSITIPLAYQAAAVVGLAVVAWGLVRQPWRALRTFDGQLNLLLVGWLVLPLALVMVLHSAIYDGWRHLYFVYPALLLFTIEGGLAVARFGQRHAGWRKLALGLALLAGAEAVLTAVRMVRMHPHQQVYFSYLTSQQAERLFERDYWALSYRQGLEYLVARQPQGTILVDAAQSTPLESNVAWLAPRDRARVVQTARGAGQYIITSYRSISGAYPDTVGQEVFAVRADGIKILSVFKRPAASPSATR